MTPKTFPESMQYTARTSPRKSVAKKSRMRSTDRKAPRAKPITPLVPSVATVSAKALIRSFQWAELERKHNKPMRDILLEAHAQHGNFEAMGRALVIARDTAVNWWMWLGLPECDANDDGTVTIVVCGETTDPEARARRAHESGTR